MKNMSKTVSGIVALFLMSAFPVLSLASSAPQILSVAPTNAGSTTITLNGYFNANGAVTSTWFKYGVSAGNLDHLTPPVNQGNGTGQFGANVSGLTPNTTYFFKAVGSNFYGMTEATSVLTFTTTAYQGASLSVQTITQSNVEQHTATLNGHYSATVTAPTVWFKYGLSANNLNILTNPQSMAVGSNSFSANLSGLQSNTTYFYKAFGSQAGNLVSATNVLQFTTLVTPPVIFTVTTNTQTNVTTTSADLNGYISLANTTANSRYFKWGTSANNLNNTLNVSGGQTVSGSFTGSLSGITPNTTYFFKAYADGVGGAVAATNTLSFTTTANPITYACNDGADNDGDGLTDLQDPGCLTSTDNDETNTVTSSAPSVSTGSVTNVSEYNATLGGNINSNNSYTYYWFEYGTNSSLSSSTSHMGFGIANSTVNQSIGNLSPNTLYSYKICASNGYGSNCGNINSFTTLSAGCTYNCGGGCTYNCGGGCTYNCGGNAPVVNTSSASNVTDTSATLYGYINPNGSYNTQVWFKYGQNGNLSYTAYPNPSNISYQQTVAAPISNLQSNTVYGFQLCASNQYGQNCGNILSFVTTNTNAYVPVQPYYPPYQPQYPAQQAPIIIYTNTGGGNDYVAGTSSLATLKINASKSDAVRNDLVSYTITLENNSNRKLKDIVMHVSAPMDLALISTSLGEISFNANTVTVKLSSLAVGGSESFTVTARVASNTNASSFVVHSDASYLNTKTDERETVTAELMTGMARNGLLAGALGAGFGGGIIWFLAIILAILLTVILFSGERRKKEVAIPMPPSKWPTN